MKSANWKFSLEKMIDQTLLWKRRIMIEPNHENRQ